MEFTIGIKKEMTQVYGEDGLAYPVTLVDVADAIIAGTKTKQNDGYNAVIVGIGKKKANKAETTKFKDLKHVPHKVVEFRVDELPEELKVGEKVAFEVDEKQKLNITGTTKGKGFAGVVKRWGFKGGPKTHGQSDRLRAPGSIGSGTTPGRVYKGKKMAGRMGGERQTTTNLKVVKFDEEDSLLYVQGAVPGSRESYVLISKATR
ncbi:50S ribosomal protein L3 [Candidatus Dojkabacteria bacterium]|nr:50S ribosomal protein L3 [Candidatus Dojkabacteria bacterium]